jgi:PadR family transcriptional regulator AphA
LSSTTPLTPTSFIVLGLLELAGPSTPYALKQGIAMSLGNFWTLPHSQLYAEPQRLAGAGLVTEDVEEGGRRRRTYAITAAGRAALREWTSAPVAALPELRDIALLKLFFGADPGPIAGEQAERYREKLAEYREIHGNLSKYGGPGSEGPLRTLEAGIAVSEALAAFWEGLTGG